MMEVIAVAHRTVHNTKHGGSPALATQLGMSSTVLNSKVNTRCNTHHLRLDEALSIMEFTGDTSILQAMAQRMGGVFTPITAEASEETLIMQVLKIGGRGGCLLTAFQQALEDGCIVASEYQEIKDILQLQKAAIQSMENALDARFGGASHGL